MKTTTVRHYQARMLRVLDYIDAHLEDDLSVEVLSGVAAFSKHHFHRQFSEWFGLTAHRYVQLSRLSRASGRLAYHAASTITEIALDSGYEGPEAFARAFKQQIGQTPSQFRKQPEWTPWRLARGPLTDARRRSMPTRFDDTQVKIIDFPTTAVAVMAHQGDPALIGETIRRFIAWRKQAGLTPPASATFNILHSDPEAAPEDYRLDLCAGLNRSIAPNDPEVTLGEITGGRCASLRFTGASDDLRAAVSFLYADWLPRSGEELRDTPIFVQRVRFFPEVPEHEAVTDVFLPLV